MADALIGPIFETLSKDMERPGDSTRMMQHAPRSKTSRGRVAIAASPSAQKYTQNKDGPSTQGVRGRKHSRPQMMTAAQ